MVEGRRRIGERGRLIVGVATCSAVKSTVGDSISGKAATQLGDACGCDACGCAVITTLDGSGTWSHPISSHDVTGMGAPSQSAEQGFFGNQSGFFCNQSGSLQQRPRQGWQSTMESQGCTHQSWHCDPQGLEHLGSEYPVGGRSAW